MTPQFDYVNIFITMTVKLPDGHLTAKNATVVFDDRLADGQKWTLNAEIDGGEFLPIPDPPPEVLVYFNSLLGNKSTLIHQKDEKLYFWTPGNSLQVQILEHRPIEPGTLSGWISYDEPNEPVMYTFTTNVNGDFHLHDNAPFSGKINWTNGEIILKWDEDKASCPRRCPLGSVSYKYERT